MKRRIVVDTNVYVSRMLRADSVSGRAVAKVWRAEIPLISQAAHAELRDVLSRPKFAAYVQPGALEPYLDLVWSLALPVHVTETIRACRDPRDDKFLELAVCGRADLIVSGDADLLALRGFRGIAIVTPAEFLDEEKAGGAQGFKD